MTFLDLAVEQYEKQPAIDPKTLHHLVLDYLIQGCFSETTSAFLAGISPSSSLTNTPASPIQLTASLSQSMHIFEHRKTLQKLVFDGKMIEVFTFCNQVFPGALTGSDQLTLEIVFELKVQHFIELVKTKSSMDALKYAQECKPSFFLSGLIIYTGNIHLFYESLNN